MVEEKKLSFKEIKEFYKERKLDPLHTNSSYHCLDGSKLTTDVGYFESCMENGFLVDLELFMTGRSTSGGSGGAGPLCGDVVFTPQCVRKCSECKESVCYAGGRCWSPCNAGPLYSDAVSTAQYIGKCGGGEGHTCGAGAGHCCNAGTGVSLYEKNDK